MPPQHRRTTPAQGSLSLELPAEILEILGPTSSEAAQCLKQLALIELFRRGEVSSGYAAEVLGMSRWEFIQLLGKHGVSYLEASEEDLQRQVEAARPHKSPPSKSPSRTPAP